MDTKRYTVVTHAFRMVFFMIGCVAVGAKEGPGRGAYVPPPSVAAYSTESIIASGQRGGDLTPTGDNTTEEFNREMGLAMETWNEHRWDEALPMFQAIYRNHPESPWAAEAELHEACYLKYNSRYDEAEERFLSVFNKHSKERIRKRVLYYLPHLYAQTGRAKAAQECLLLLNEFELN